MQPKLAATISRLGFRPAIFLLRGLLLGFALFFPASSLQAQAPAPVAVLKIVITNVGPQSVSTALVRANIRVKEGDSYSRSSIDDDVRNLYATGYFLNIRVAEERSVDGVTLIYVLQGKPKLTDIVLVGNKKLSTSKLKKKLTSKIGEPLDERKLFADVQEIKKLYQKKGYPQTTVEYKLNVEERFGRGTATIEISETPKVQIDDVVFDGASAFTQKKLRKALKTRRHWWLSWITQSGTLKDEQLEDDKEKLVEFYADAGYIDFELKEGKFEYLTDRKLVLHFVISEGRRYKVGALQLKGLTLFPTNEVGKKLKMNVESIFTPKGLTKDIEAIQDLFGSKGYIDARVIARKTPNTQTGTMDLVYELEEGEKSFIEKIEIKGNIKTKDRVLRRELAVSPGEVFDSVRVKLSKQRLEGLSFFERVETQAEPTDVPDRKNLVIAVNEKNTGNFTIGAGFSSVDSILGFVEVSQSNFDLFKPPWFVGAGQKMRLRISIGDLRREYTVSFIEPWFLGKKLQFSTDLYHVEKDFVSLNDYYNERRTGARVGLSKALGSDFLIGGVSYTIENVGIVAVIPTAPAFIKQEEGYRLVSKVGTSLAYDTRNSALLPDKGQRTELRTEVAGGPLGGESDFYRLELGTHWYFKGIWEGNVLEFMARGGVVQHYGDSTYVPFYDRFYLGGIESLRGYRYREVGPREGGEATGGDTYWFGSLEYSIPIIDRVRFALFYDIGMVYPDAYSFDTKGSNTGFYNDNYGLGIRLNLPIGPLKLDYGIPINSSPDNHSHGRFQFSAGYTREF